MSDGVVIARSAVKTIDMTLITYAYRKHGHLDVSFHHDTAESIWDWLKKIQQYDNAEYAIVHTVEMPSEVVQWWCREE